MMTKKFDAADSIRGFACCIVLIVHAIAIFFPVSFPYLAGCGKIGVWLFFVLSAFLLTSKFDSTGFSVRSLFTYAIGRFLRIMPIYILAVILYWIFGTAGINSSQDVKYAIFFKQGYAHLWTIPVEFKFYLLLPFITAALIFVRNKLGLAAMIALAATATFLLQGIYPYWLTPENTIETFWYLPSFVIGSVTALIKPKRKIFNETKYPNIIAITIISLMIFLSPGARHLILNVPLDTWLRNQFIYLSFLWATFIFVIIHENALFSFFNSYILKKLGNYSFSIYLIHWLFYGKIAQLHMNSFTWMFIALISSIAAGGLMYYLIEKPIEAWRHRWLAK